MKIQRIPTGIPGMDELLEGGFPSDAMILLTGHAGAGKSIFSSQFLYNCALETRLSVKELKRKRRHEYAGSE